VNGIDQMYLHIPAGVVDVRCCSWAKKKSQPHFWSWDLGVLFWGN